MFEGLAEKKPGQAGKAAALVKGPRADKNARLRKVMGARFMEGREINGWGQSEAALKLGYGNSTQLSLIERGERLAPVEIIKHAANVYGVSADYLMGLSDEPERDPKHAEKRAQIRQMQGMLTDHAETLIETMLDHIATGAPTVQTTRTLLEGVKKHAEASARFIELQGKKFETLKGGNSLQVSLKSMDSLIQNSELLLNRHDHFVTKTLAANQIKRQNESRERAERRMRERQRGYQMHSTAPDQFHLTLGEAANEERMQ
jgi:transcriptional regulator with XRE-family HTH domain